MAIAVVAVSPGIAPKIMPTPTQINTRIRHFGSVTIERNPANKLACILYTPYPKMPFGSISPSPLVKIRYTATENTAERIMINTAFFFRSSFNVSMNDCNTI